MQIIRVMGIDPALSNTGLVAADVPVDNPTLFTIRAMELVQTEDERGKQVRRSSDDFRRGLHIAQYVRDFAKKHDIRMAFSEIPTGAKSARATMGFGIVVGCLATFALDTPLVEVNPSEVKMAAVGVKQASKEEMIDWAVERFPGADWIVTKRKNEMEMAWDGGWLHKDNEHLADAAAAIAAGVRTTQFRGMVALYKNAA